MTVGYLLSEEDRRKLRELLARAGITLQPDRDLPPPGSPEVYVARAQDEGSIPSLERAGEGDSYDHPGCAVCDIYKVMPSVAEGWDWDLVPISGLTRPVFNLTEDYLADWMLVIRDKAGRWFAAVGGGGGDGLPEGTTTNDILRWDADQGEWVIHPAPAAGTGSGSGSGSGSGTGGSTTYVLGIVDGVMQWIEVSDAGDFTCP